MATLAVGHKRTGACPTFDRPVLQRDGYLLRIPLIGGALTPPQLASVAATAATSGNGIIELTNRGNLQARGLGADAVDGARAALRERGLGDPGAALVTISPFAGPAEHALRDALVATIEGLLADGRPLSPKFVVHVDDADGSTGERRAEATLQLADGTCRIRIPELGEATVAIDGAVTAVRALAEACRTIAADARVADVIDACGPAWLHAVLPLDLDGRTLARPTSTPSPDPGSLVTIGDATWFLAGARFGRVDAAVLTELAELPVEVRVTPWRSFAIAWSPDPTTWAAVLERLASMGLIVDPADPAAGVISCIGAAGCWQTEADTLLEAERVVAQRAASPAFVPGTVHVTGCDKRCATRGQVAVTLLGRPDGSGFDEVLGA